MHYFQVSTYSLSPLPELSAAGMEFGKKLEGDELYFGDFMDDRYEWELKTMKVLLEPVPAKGQLSLWNWDDGSK
ncbi:hypothetical protein [Lysinibacillus capsici]|uniref:hypothetical protein n=1 Tax=Lysinibacillus TaxID=400634 RepID=UPI0028ADEF7C|nr:hypothetical protein [Lysinibacillus capsici]